MSMIVYLVLAASAVVGCYGNTFKMGACPRVTVKDNVDFDRFLGEWHVVQRFNPMATCTKIVLEKTPEGGYTVNETSRPLGLRFGYHQQYIKARQLTFLRNDTKSIFKIERNLAHFTLSTFGIVDTDYDNYALVWGCDPVLFGSVQNVDIWSRQPRPEPDTIKPAKDLVKNMGVDYHPLDNVDQSHCTEGSNEEGSTSGNEGTNNMVAG